MHRQPLLQHNFQPFDSLSFHDPALASLSVLSYRPTLQLPLRPSELASYNLSQITTPPPAPVTMAYLHDPDEQQRLQKLSSEYQPEITGPLVSERQPSTAITTEFANADPVYRAKTAALPQKYSHFRTCRRDGHCGWRAVAFCYFETLLRLGDPKKFLDEEARLRSLSNLLNSVGFQEYLYEDWADSMFNLLRSTSLTIGSPDAEAQLLRHFNDDDLGLSIITYIKLLTSAWIQTRPDEFEPFLLGQDTRTYCATTIEPTNCEIEHVGMKALVDVLISPARFAVEILYLDRSPGTEVNVHSFAPNGTDGLPVPNPPTLRFLYRIGHYDILYKLEDIQHPIISRQPITVNLASQADQYRALDVDSSDVLAWIPGMSMLPAHMSQPGYLPQPFDFSPNTISQPPPQSTPQPTPMHSYSLPVSPTSQDFIPQSIPVEPPPLNMSMSSPVTMQSGGPFRPSVWEFEPEVASGLSHNTFQTSIFKNSHFNTAHYMNPEFQPEEWTPDSEYAPSGRSRHKSSSS